MPALAPILCCDIEAGFAVAAPTGFTGAALAAYILALG